MVTGYHIAQMNIGRAAAPLDSPQMKDFMDGLDRINALADADPGFVWRLQSDTGNATDILLSDDPLFIVNMSVWRDIESLSAFVYKSDHVAFMRRRREWFEKPAGAHMALWWVPAGVIPTPQEGLDRVRHLDRRGPTAHAFTFKVRFPAPEAAMTPGGA